jgi:3-isopropylmalate/(R)-2-methylmalate dehydratase small subunit|tara:strand:+ start:1181 stop:1798 length:618 start_codon:yes stop_codon:yes gene_type:complete
MDKFISVKGIAALLELSNIDTDMIIPKQFLKTIKRDGLGEGLFYEMRFDEKGDLNKEFILNRKPFKNSKIIISYENFGCGSSREHAPWALLDFGIKVIIAKSFADIFFNNCFKNGILPIILPNEKIEDLVKQVNSGNHILNVDLRDQVINSNQININFEIDPYKKKCLLNGWDDIDLTLKEETKILNFEKKQIKEWLYPIYEKKN